VAPSDVTVAIVQQPPAVLDLARSLQRAESHLADAARRGARLVVFPEAWLTCYPAWVFGMAQWDDPTAREWYALLLGQSPVLDPAARAGGPVLDDLQALREAAAAHDLTVVMGLNERAGEASGTLYNSLITIGPDGSTLNLHRKLSPTHTERIVWAAGDGAGLVVCQTPAGRVGGLVCWEHWNPLARQALHAQEEQLHVAAWPDSPEMHHIAARSYAFEGRCFVLSAAQLLHTDDVPEQFLDAFREGVGPDAPETGWLFDGGSGVVAPSGEWIAGPVAGQAQLIVCSVDLAERDARTHDLDVAGHYARPDVLTLSVDRRRRGSGVTFR
jgi:predicted amidohydrolase